MRFLLRDEVNKALKIKTEGYTKESVDILKLAIVDDEKVMSDKNVTVDQVKVAIENYMEVLKFINITKKGLQEILM